MKHDWKNITKCPAVSKCLNCGWSKEEYRVMGKIKTIYYSEHITTQFEPACLQEQNQPSPSPIKS